MIRENKQAAHLLYRCEPWEATRVQATAYMLWILGAYSINLVSYGQTEWPR